MVLKAARKKRWNVEEEVDMANQYEECMKKSYRN